MLKGTFSSWAAESSMFDRLHIWTRVRSGTIGSLEAQWVQYVGQKDDWRRTFDAMVPNNCTTEASEHYTFVTGVTTPKQLTVLHYPKQFCIIFLV